jgi:hypothetical protein
MRESFEMLDVEDVALSKAENLLRGIANSNDYYDEDDQRDVW